MVLGKSTSDRIFNIVNHTLITLLVLAFLYPMWHVAMASISDPSSLLRNTGPIVLPVGKPTLVGYQFVLRNKNIMTGYLNTIFYVVVGTAINMVLTIIGAYVLSRKDLMHKRLITILIVFTMYVHAGIIPNYLLVEILGMMNTRWALIIPSAISTWNMIVMRTAFSQISRSLEESAKIDGANDITILCRIILPVAKATIAVIILFYVVSHWNAWFSAMIYLRDRDKYPLQLFLREILIANTTMGNSGEMSSMDGQYFMEELLKYCTIIVSTVPILCIYPLVQRHFVTGVMMGSLKE